MHSLEQMEQSKTMSSKVWEHLLPYAKKEVFLPPGMWYGTWYVWSQKPVYTPPPLDCLYERPDSPPISHIPGSTEIYELEWGLHCLGDMFQRT